MNKIRKGDSVIVITGRDKGKRGTVTQRVDEDHVVVEGINVAKKHVKPNPMKGTTGGVVDKTMPIHQSNIAIFNPKTGKADRVGIRALTADTSIDFGSYGLSKGSQLPGAKQGGVDEFGMTDDHIQHIVDVINRHESIVISGATSTGKTTFTNKIIEMLGLSERIITVEDARELTVPNPNRVHLMVPRNRGTNNVNYATIIDSLMRLTPDWIICGELSVDNAQPIYATMGKGHPIITTVHAGSPKEAVSAFANNMSLGSGKNAPLSGIELVKSIRSQIGCIIQLERRDGKRQVVDIVFPSQEEKALQ